MKNSLIKYLASSCAILAMHGVDVYAQDATGEAKDKDRVAELIDESSNEEALSFAFGVPDSPALAFAGIKAEDVTQVNQLQDFIITIPSLQKGSETLGVDVNLANLFKPLKSFEDTLDYYKKDKNLAYRLMRRSRLSILARNGSTNAADTSKSVNSLIVAGWAVSVLDTSDPLYTAFHEKTECKTYFTSVNKMLENFTLPPHVLLAERQLLDAEAILPRINIIQVEQLTQIRDGIDSARAQLSITKVPPVDIVDISQAQGVLSSSHQVIQALHKEIKTLKGLINANDPKKSFYRSDPAVAKSLLGEQKACFVVIEETIKLEPNLDVGAALLWSGNSEGFGDFKSGGQAFWASYRFPLTRSIKSSRYWVAGVTGRLGLDEFVSTGNDVTPQAKADTLQGWVGLEHLSDTWRLAARYGYVKTEFDDPLQAIFSSKGEKWLVSSDLQLQDNVWIGLSYGKANGTTDVLTGNVLKVNLKFQQPKEMNIFNR